MNKQTAELIINGPNGQSSAQIKVMEDGRIKAWAADTALSYALNLYNELEKRKEDE